MLGVLLPDLSIDITRHRTDDSFIHTLQRIEKTTPHYCLIKPVLHVDTKSIGWTGRIPWKAVIQHNLITSTRVVQCINCRVGDWTTFLSTNHDYNNAVNRNRSGGRRPRPRRRRRRRGGARVWCCDVGNVSVAVMAARSLTSARLIVDHNTLIKHTTCPFVLYYRTFCTHGLRTRRWWFNSQFVHGMPPNYRYGLEFVDIQMCQMVYVCIKSKFYKLIKRKLIHRSQCPTM